MKRELHTTGINTDGQQDVTALLQKKIDEATENDSRLVIDAGRYLVSSLFLKNNSDVVLSEGAVLVATTDESRYPLIPTRVAGIEMDWYPAVINVVDTTQVSVSGAGCIEGNGPYWWNKYWGEDGTGGMRKEYDAKGLRWACDYDCIRVRGVCVYRSSDVSLSGFTVHDAGFWNVHICYSSNVVADGLKIRSGAEFSPSTDGIDIDSSCDVVVKNCETHCNDDSICIKSGRDTDGMRVGIPCERITIENCHIYDGFGITIGSELSGGIQDIVIRDCDFHGTECGFRVKSSRPRCGFIRRLLATRLTMENVHYPVHICLNWNPAYCYCELPAEAQCQTTGAVDCAAVQCQTTGTVDCTAGVIPVHYAKLLAKVDNVQDYAKICGWSGADCERVKKAGRNLTYMEDVCLSEITATYAKNFNGDACGFYIEGYEDAPLRGITFENVTMKVPGIAGECVSAEVSQINCDITGSECRRSEAGDFDKR